MLALKANRFSLKFNLLAAQYGSLCSGEYPASSMAILNCGIRYKKQPVLRVYDRFTGHSAVAPFAFTAARFYADRPTQPSSQPSPPFGFPDKQQLEKYFFKAVALLWDLSVWAYTLSMRNVDKHVVKNPTVQIYWQQFIKKVEESRKN